MAAYDAVVRELATELQARMGDLPPVPVGEPSGLQRQQAVDPNAPQISAPVVMDSPDVLYMLPAMRQVSAELDLTVRADSPLKRRETDSEAGDQPASPLKRRETDIESETDLSGASADANMPELPAMSEDDGEETEEVSGDESESDEEAEEEVSGDADDESGVDTNTAEVIHHVEADTDGLHLSFHRQKGGDLAVRLETPVWMLGVLMAVMTVYMWMVVYLLKSK
jgi:hypothetical protein